MASLKLNSHHAPITRNELLAQLRHLSTNSLVSKEDELKAAVKAANTPEEVAEAKAHLADFRAPATNMMKVKKELNALDAEIGSNRPTKAQLAKRGELLAKKKELDGYLIQFQKEVNTFLNPATDLIRLDERLILQVLKTGRESVESSKVAADNMIKVMGQAIEAQKTKISDTQALMQSDKVKSIKDSYQLIMADAHDFVAESNNKIEKYQKELKKELESLSKVKLDVVATASSEEKSSAREAAEVKVKELEDARSAELMAFDASKVPGYTEAENKETFRRTEMVKHNEIVTKKYEKDLKQAQEQLGKVMKAEYQAAHGKKDLKQGSETPAVQVVKQITDYINSVKNDSDEKSIFFDNPMVLKSELVGANRDLLESIIPEEYKAKFQKVLDTMGAMQSALESRERRVADAYAQLEETPGAKGEVEEWLTLDKVLKHQSMVLGKMMVEKERRERAVKHGVFADEKPVEVKSDFNLSLMDKSKVGYGFDRSGPGMNDSKLKRMEIQTDLGVDDPLMMVYFYEGIKKLVSSGNKRWVNENIMGSSGENIKREPNTDGAKDKGDKSGTFNVDTQNQNYFLRDLTAISGRKWWDIGKGNIWRSIAAKAMAAGVRDMGTTGDRRAELVDQLEANTVIHRKDKSPEEVARLNDERERLQKALVVIDAGANRKGM